MIYKPAYTVADYEKWPGDWELWQGTAVAMTPSPFGRHQFVLVNLVSELRSALRGTGWIVLAEIDWPINEMTVVRPDAVVISGPVPERHLNDTPHVVVEILSESTAEKDRTAKLDLYQHQGVRNYLLLDPDQQTLESFVMDENGCYHVVDIADGCWAFGGPNETPVSIETSRLFE